MSCSPAESSIYSPRLEEEEEARRGGGGGGGGGEEISVDVFFFLQSPFKASAARLEDDPPDI